MPIIIFEIKNLVYQLNSRFNISKEINSEMKFKVWLNHTEHNTLQ